jgi:hypothetical protein
MGDWRHALLCGRHPVLLGGLPQSVVRVALLSLLLNDLPHSGSLDWCWNSGAALVEKH